MFYCASLNVDSDDEEEKVERKRVNKIHFSRNVKRNHSKFIDYKGFYSFFSHY